MVLILIIRLVLWDIFSHNELSSDYRVRAWGLGFSLLTAVDDVNPALPIIRNLP